MDLLFRTDYFNIAKRKRRSTLFRGTSSDANIIQVQTKKNNLSQKLHATSNILSGIFLAKDYRLITLGQVTKENEPVDTKLGYLEANFFAPETLLAGIGIQIGIIGQPRENYTWSFMIKENVVKAEEESEILTVTTTHKSSATAYAPVAVSPFMFPQLPRSEELPDTFPKGKPRYPNWFSEKNTEGKMKWREKCITYKSPKNN